MVRACSALGVHRQIADALPRQGQGLGEGVAGDGVVIEPGGVSGLRTGEQQLPIWARRDEIDGVAELARFSSSRAASRVRVAEDSTMPEGLLGEFTSTAVTAGFRRSSRA